tara:strand:- start:201 stop:335 length:135 start_codon:yes stop_codon:yes gene_type:complete
MDEEVAFVFPSVELKSTDGGAELVLSHFGLTTPVRPTVFSSAAE